MRRAGALLFAAGLAACADPGPWQRAETDAETVKTDTALCRRQAARDAEREALIHGRNTAQVLPGQGRTAEGMLNRLSMRDFEKDRLRQCMVALGYRRGGR